MAHPVTGSPIHPVIMVSTDSTSQAFRFIDHKPRVASTPYGYDVAEGNVPGHTPFFKSGYNGDIDAVEEDIWVVGGTYVFPATSGIRMEVVSSVAQDAATSTGARTVRISYLDSNYNAQSTILSLNGVTEVETSASNIARINAFRVVTAGTYNAAYGVISLRATGNTPIYSQISSGQNRARNPVYTVPTSQSLYVTDIAGSVTNPSGGRSGIFKLKANYDDLTTAADGDLFWPFFEIGEEDGSFMKSLQCG